LGVFIMTSAADNDSSSPDYALWKWRRWLP
jgi:hypothetical protein